MSASLSVAKLTFFIAILAAVGQATQTMYVPSIGYMAQEFLVSPAALQAVMACYLIPYGLSQFVYGTLSDRIGRKPIIIAGLAIYIIGSLIALFAHQYSWFLIGSFVQGLGIGCGGAMSRTLSRDCFEGAELHKVNSLISMCLIFSPLVAPVLGGYLTESFGWRSSYLFLSLFAIAVVITMMTSMVETLPATARKKEPVLRSYHYVLSDRRFQGYLICLVATFAGLAVFEAAAGVLLGGVLGLPATTVSLLFVLPIPGYLAGAWLSNVIARHWREKNRDACRLTRDLNGLTGHYAARLIGYDHGLITDWRRNHLLLRGWHFIPSRYHRCTFSFPLSRGNGRCNFRWNAKFRGRSGYAVCRHVPSIRSTTTRYYYASDVSTGVVGT